MSNSAYRSIAPLPACAASAALVSGALRRGGWTVTELRDPSNGQLGAEISRFGDRVAQADGAAALLYACGYGAGFENRLFLLPASAQIRRETDILTEGVVAPALTGALVRASPRAGLVVLDLAASPDAAAPVADAPAIRAPAPTTGVLVAVSQALPDAATPAATALAAALEAPGQEVGAMIDALRSAVAGVPRIATAAARPQGPAWLDAPPSPPVVAAVPEPEPAPTPPEPAQAALPKPVPVPAAAPIPPPAPPAGPVELDQPGRRQVQLALQRMGYYAGQVDGVFGPESLAAIRRYQHEVGGAMTGRLTTEQAARLLPPR